MAEQYDGFISYSHAADDLLAPRLQSGLQRFAKPWWKRRALRVFRDESSLSANPHLWSSITDALDNSEWFVLLLSEEAARSEWVNREVEYWLQHKDPSRILPVVTDGEFSWVGGDVSGSAAPEALSGAFSEEPRWVDLRWARRDEHLDLNNPRFSDAVANIASAIRGIPKDELASEEVKQHRRTVRTAWAAGIVVLLLGIAATVGAIVAVGQSNEAEDQRDEAQRQAEIARENAEEAQRQRAEAERAARLAKARELTASAVAVLEEDPELAIRLTLEAVDVTPEGEGQSVEAINVLREAMAADRLHARHQVSDTPGSVQSRISADGKLAAIVSSNEGTLSLVDLDTGQTRWTYRDLATNDSFDAAEISPDGTYVVLAIHDHVAGGAHGHDEEHGDEGLGDDGGHGEDPHAGEGHDDEGPAEHGSGEAADATGDGFPARLVVLDAADGTALNVFESGRCDFSTLNFGGTAFSADGSLLAVITGTEECRSGLAEDDWLELWDTTTWEPVSKIHAGITERISFAADAPLGLVTGPGTPAVLVDLDTGDEIRRFDGAIGALSPDGSLLALADLGENPLVEIRDAVTGEVERRLHGVDGRLGVALYFTRDGSQVLTETSTGQILIWDTATGRVLEEIHGSGFAGLSISDDGSRILSNGFGTAVLEFRVGPAADPSSRQLYATGSSQPLRSVPFPTAFFDAFDAVQTSSGITVAWGEADDSVPASDYLNVIDPETGRVSDSVMARSFVSRHDGTFVIAPLDHSGAGRPMRGQPAIWDPTNGDLRAVGTCQVPLALEFDIGGDVTTCSDGEPFFGMLVAASVDGRLIGGVSPAGTLRMWEADELEMIVDTPLPDPPASIPAMTESWILLDPVLNNRLFLVEVGSGQVLREIAPGWGPIASALLNDGDAIALGSSGGQVRLLDTSDWSIRVEWQALDGVVSGLAPSPDGSRLLVVGYDSSIRVWDLTDPANPSEEARIPASSVVDGMWIDDETIGLLRTDGVWAVETLDFDRLIAAARARLARPEFTAAECAVYGIGGCAAVGEPEGEHG